MSARSCDQLCPITADHISATCQCSSVPRASAHKHHINATYQCIPVHINTTYQCPSDLPFNVTHQCQSVPPINANQCHLLVLPISATYQCQSVSPISASQCRLSVPVSAA
ncbi:unnamed protein product [Staurois parvus]|uniref:Uncharacterized protein n=1 Tax=Staurois parvus TaxID=386267 RepID=A0ABN9EBF8_9NEOB|nr:unnamed protein product [Staurois parvus]